MTQIGYALHTQKRLYTNKRLYTKTSIYKNVNLQKRQSTKTQKRLILQTTYIYAMLP